MPTVNQQQWLNVNKKVKNDGLASRYLKVTQYQKPG